MAPQFNSSSSTSPLSFRFAYWIAYLIAPIGSWMNISKLVHLKPNMIFTSTHTPKTSPAVFSISESTNAYVEPKTWSHPWCSFLCHTSISKPINCISTVESAHFSTLPFKSSYCNSFLTDLPMSTFILLQTVFPIAVWVILLNNNSNHVTCLLKSHHS